MFTRHGQRLVTVGLPPEAESLAFGLRFGGLSPDSFRIGRVIVTVKEGRVEM